MTLAFTLLGPGQAVGDRHAAADDRVGAHAAGFVPAQVHGAATAFAEARRQAHDFGHRAIEEVLHRGGDRTPAGIVIARVQQAQSLGDELMVAAMRPGDQVRRIETGHAAHGAGLLPEAGVRGAVHQALPGGFQHPLLERANEVQVIVHAQQPVGADGLPVLGRRSDFDPWGGVAELGGCGHSRSFGRSQWFSPRPVATGLWNACMQTSRQVDIGRPRHCQHACRCPHAQGSGRRGRGRRNSMGERDLSQTATCPSDCDARGHAVRKGWDTPGLQRDRLQSKEDAKASTSPSSGRMRCARETGAGVRSTTYGPVRRADLGRDGRAGPISAGEGRRPSTRKACRRPCGLLPLCREPSPGPGHAAGGLAACPVCVNGRPGCPALRHPGRPQEYPTRTLRARRRRGRGRPD